MPTPLRYAARPAAALAAGLCLWLAFPDADLWFLAPVGVALLGAATLTAGGRRGAALGMLAGLAFFVPTLSWSGIYVGALPWFALATLEASRGHAWRSARRTARWPTSPAGSAPRG